MESTAQFPDVSEKSGLYESFFVRAVSPDEPVGIWIRYTVQKAPNEQPAGSVWCTIFDGRLGKPYMHRVTTDELSAPTGGWLAIGTSSIRAGTADGSSGDARWSLRFHPLAPDLHHLRPEWLYRAPVPRTKLTSPAPIASFDGRVSLAGRDPIELTAWPGMVGHNWGTEHAERWIWLSGLGFEQDPTAWLDVAIGRLRIGPWLSPWIANGAVAFGGRRYRLGGLGARGLRVAETSSGCEVQIPGTRGRRLHLRATVPEHSAAQWRYVDPAAVGSQVGHEVMNCSIAGLDLDVRVPGATEPVRLRTDHGGTYELGSL